jgi:diacylglycerol O-acyltransferase / wax synthase
MQQLSGLDASFLYLETPNAPMHVGGVLLFEPKVPGGRFDLPAYRRVVASRLHVARTFRQRLVNVPLDLGRPYWIEDPDFDLDFHLHHMALPRPGGWKELTRLTAHVFAQPLDRRRPLWEMTFVEGLDHVFGLRAGAFAIITKVHHAGIDGGSGAEILGALLSLEPNARTAPPVKPWKPEHPPSDWELLTRAGGNALQPLRLANLLGRTGKSIVQAGALWGLKGAALPPVPFATPRTRLNVPITPHRVWGGTLLGLDRIKRIKTAVPGVTVNDVVLALCAGALRRYLKGTGDLPSKPLVAMAPISIRKEDERGAMGNQVSAMLVRLATSEADPIRRLQLIHDGAARSKGYHQAIGARTLTDYTHFIPFSVAGLAARLYTRMQVARMHSPPFNVVITNVPGPAFPLYLGDARLAANLGAGPIFDGMGLFLAIFSYAGQVAITATSCREIMPDVDAFVGLLEDSLEELEAALMPRRRRPNAPKKAPRRPASKKAARPSSGRGVRGRR